MAQAYKFRLQKLLDIRKNFEEKSKIEFTDAQREKQLVEAQLNNLEEKYKSHRNINSYESLVQQKIKQNYLNALNFSINETQISLEDKHIIVEQKREKLRVCQIEKKTVEILKEKQKSAFLKEQDLIEQKTNDEFALYGFIRNNHRSY